MFRRSALKDGSHWRSISGRWRPGCHPMTSLRRRQQAWLGLWTRVRQPSPSAKRRRKLKPWQTLWRNQKAQVSIRSAKSTIETHRSQSTTLTRSQAYKKQASTSELGLSHAMTPPFPSLLYLTCQLPPSPTPKTPPPSTNTATGLDSHTNK